MATQQNQAQPPANPQPAAVGTGKKIDLPSLAKVANYGAVGGIIFVGIKRLLEENKSDTQNAVLTVYLLMFCALIISAEMQMQYVGIMFGFMLGRMGRGLFITFCGSLFVQDSIDIEMIIGIAIVAIGILNILIRFKLGENIIYKVSMEDYARNYVARDVDISVYQPKNNTSAGNNPNNGPKTVGKTGGGLDLAGNKKSQPVDDVQHGTNNKPNQGIGMNLELDDEPETVNKQSSNQNNIKFEDGNHDFNIQLKD